MSDAWKSISAWLTIFGSVVGYYLGNIDGLLIALCAMVVLDILSGFLKAILTKKMSSQRAFKGSLKKIAIFLIVGAANILDSLLLNENALLRSGAIIFYIANEGVSILENVCLMGIPVPEKIKSVLLELRAKESEEHDNYGNGDAP